MAFFQAEHLWISQLQVGVAVLYLDSPGSKVNILSRQLRAELRAALLKVGTEPEIRLLVLRSGKEKHFLAGADLHELLAIATPTEAESLAEEGQLLCQLLADLPIPTVAVLGGACLGGGLELALACDYRVALEQPGTQFGFPEVELGLLPAWGGTQRLPRVIGLERALQMILGGQRLRAREAYRWHLVDALCTPSDPLPPTFLEQPVKRQPTGLPHHTWRQRLLESTRPGRWFLWRGTERRLARLTPDDMPAPREALQAIRVGLEQGREAGLRQEREAASRLAGSPASHSLIDVFLRSEQLRQPSSADRAAAGGFRSIGVVGTGPLGAQLVHLAGRRGASVTVQEDSQQQLGFGVLRILEMYKESVERGTLALDDLPKLLQRMKGTVSWTGFRELDLVIDARAPGQQDLRAIEEHIVDQTILVAAASWVRVQHLQAGLRRPGRVAGLHFLPAAERLLIVEIPRSPGTKPDVLERLGAWVLHLGKIPVFVKDAPGFLVQRLQLPCWLEAAQLVCEGVRIELIDQAMQRFGMTGTPLRLLDALGIDHAQRMLDNLQPVFGERFPASPALACLQAAGWLGRKTGKGFYHHRGSWRGVHGAAQTQLWRLSTTPRAPATPAEIMAEVRERLTLLVVNEAYRCLEEKVIDSAELLDLAMVLGGGWPAHRGGPLRYAEQLGLTNVVSALKARAAQHGLRYEPCAPLLAAPH